MVEKEVQSRMCGLGLKLDSPQDVASRGGGWYTDCNSKDVDEAEVKEDEDVAEKKRLLPQQHQYEEDSDDVVEKNGARDESSGFAPVEKMVEEVRLEKLERQIQVYQDTSLYDDAVNYMQSKYEIADLNKRQLKKAEQQAKNLPLVIWCSLISVVSQ